MPREGGATTRTFKTDVVLELGINHSQAEQQLMQIALSKPAEYFKMRHELLKDMLTDQVRAMYNMIWDVLTDGQITKSDNTKVRALRTTDDAVKKILSGADHIVPDFPEHKVNAIAMAVAEGYKELIEREVIEKLIPQNFHETAKQKTAAAAAGDLLKGAVQADV